MDYKIYKVNKTNIRGPPVYCSENETCKQMCSISQMQQENRLDIVYLEDDEEKCFKTFQILLSNDIKFEPFMFSNELFISALVSLNMDGDQQTLNFTLDSGAQINCVSVYFIQTFFSEHHIKIQPNNVRLLAANGAEIQYLGIISLWVQINQNIEYLDFFILKKGKTLILGLECMVRFGMKLDFTVIENKSEKGIFQEEMKVNNISQLSKEESKIQPLFVKFKVSTKVDLLKLDPVMLTLKILKEDFRDYIFSIAILFDCNCVSGENVTPCKYCKESAPYLSTPMDQTGHILIQYHPQYLCTIDSNQIFSAVLAPTRKQLLFYQGERKVKIIDVDCASIEMTNSQELNFISNRIKGKKGIFNNSVDPTQKFVDFEIYNQNNLCSVCEKNKDIYCNFDNPYCKNLYNFRVAAKLEYSRSLCILLEKKPISFPNMHCVFPIIQFNSEVNEEIFEGFPYLRSIYDIQKLKSLPTANIHFNEELGFYHFIFYGKYASTLEVFDFFELIVQKCKEENISEICIIDFKSFLFSRNSLEICFQSVAIKVYLVGIENFRDMPNLNEDRYGTKQDIVGVKKFRVLPKKVKKINKLPRVEYGNFAVNKVKYDNKNLVLDNKKSDKDLADLLNILTDCPDVNKKFKELATKLDQAEGGLTSVWSHDNTDIGSFHEGKYPYRKIYFKFPVIEGANLKPKPGKASFISPNLVPVAIEMITKLLKMNVVERGYSIFHAPTHFVMKPRPELSLSEFLEQGNKREDFVAGLENMQLKPSVRMVHDFHMSNSVLFCDPVFQQSPIEQLRNICYSTKYISVIDITSCYFSFSIDSQARQLSGFESGIPHIGRLRYSVCPMGLSISKNLQDCGLMHALSKCQNVMIYSDNILVISKDKWGHFEDVENVLTQLRNHGLKTKPNKISLFCSDRIRLYGTEIDLLSGKIKPDDSKIEGLKFRPVPRTKKELKSFLGSLIFFNQIAPLHGDDISCLHRHTRGSNFLMSEEGLQAYENIQKNLKENNFLYSFRPDFSRKFYISVDSSNYCSSWIIYQLCDKNHPRVCHYGFKTYSDKFEMYIPAMKELMGIICSLESHIEMFEHSQGVILYTDSLPIILCIVGSKHNKKLQRFKVFLHSLSWLTLHFAPGNSAILSLPDFFSRRGNVASKQATKQPDQCDIDNCVKIQSKICKLDHYKSTDYIFLLDALINLEESDFSSIKMHTASLKGGKLVFEKNCSRQNIPLKKEDIQTGLEPESLNSGVEDTYSGVVSGNTEKDAFMYMVKTRQRTRAEDKKNSVDESLHTDKLIKDKTEIETQDLIGEKVMSTFYSEDPNFQYCSNIEEYLSPDFSSKVPEVARPRYTIPKITNNQLENFYNNFRSVAEYLNIDLLMKAIRFDPFWKQIINHLNMQKEYRLNNKVYFIYKGILICKETLDDICLYKVVLPEIMAHSFVMQCHSHFNHIKQKKLYNQISLKFEIKDLQDIINMVVKFCFVCSLSGKVPTGRNRASLPKSPMLLRQKCLAWNFDELTVSSSKLENNFGWSKLLVGVDLFSHFLIVKPIMGQLTEKVFLDFIFEQVIQVFGYPIFISTDNGSNLDSNLVKKVLSYMNIYKGTSSPYQARSNLSELLNRIILDNMRNLAIGTFMNIEQTKQFLAPIVNLINSLPFAKERIIGPHVLMFSQIPRIDVYNFYEGSPSIFKNKHHYLNSLISLQTALNKIRIKMIDSRIYKDESERNAKYYSKIQPGAIVSLVNPSLRRKIPNHKICPRYRDRFLVVRRTKSAAYITPCSERTLEHFLKENKRFQRQEPKCLYKCDVEELKFLEDITLVVSNKHSKFYENFLVSNEFPKDFYFYDPLSSMECQVRSFEELIQGDEFSDQIMEELHDTITVKQIKKRDCLSYKSILRKDHKLRSEGKYHEDIKNIVSSFFKISKNCQEKVNQIKRNKSVTFLDEVKIHPLIKPNFIFFCRKPYMTKLKEIFDSPIRTFLTINGYHFCSCNLCRIQNTICSSDKCENCF